LSDGDEPHSRKFSTPIDLKLLNYQQTKDLEAVCEQISMEE